MINITNFIHSPELTAFLQTLPINKYQIWDGVLTNPKTIESSDVLILTVKEAKTLQKFLENNKVATILYFEKNEKVSAMYKSAKELNAFAIISSSDLIKLNEIIDQAYESVLIQRKQQFGQGKTIGIFSIKGGVGKSFVSYHLASKLSTFTKSESLLIDGGVPFGSARALLNIQSKSSWQVLRPLLKTGKDLTTSRLNSQIVKTRSQFQILNAPQNMTEEMLSASELENLIHGVKQSYPITIVDTAPIAAPQLPDFTKLFNLVIWIFTPDSNSILQTLEYAEQINKNAQDQTTLFVCNMVEPNQDRSLISSIATKLLPHKLSTIDSDPEAVKIHQRKFELISDESLLLTQQLQELAQTVFFKLSEK